MKRKVVTGIFVSALSLGLSTLETNPVLGVNGQTFTNLTGEIDTLVDGDSISYTGSLSNTIAIYFNSSSQQVDGEINISLNLTAFTLGNISEDDGYAFYFCNSTSYTANITFVLSGYNYIYSPTDNAPIFLKTETGSTGKINLIFTMADPSCSTATFLTLGSDNDNVQVLPMIYRDNCQGTEKLKDCTTEFYLSPEADDTFRHGDVQYSEEVTFYGNTGHDLDLESEENGAEPSCLESGYKTYTCNICERTVPVVIEATGHDWEYYGDVEGDWYQAPTCTEPGFRTKYCTVCGDTEEETIPATGHNYPNIPSEFVVEPTCTNSGVGKFICTECGNETEMYVDPIENKHLWSDWAVTTEADCTHDGVETRTCTECGATETNTIPASHNLDEENRIEVSGTCLNRGYMQYTCLRCGEIVKSYFDDNPYNHEGQPVLVVDTPSTEEEEGVGHYEWSCCHVLYTNENEGIRERVTICKENEHTFEYDKIIKAPNCTEEGLIVYKCGTCGLTKEVVEPPQHMFVETILTEKTCITQGSWAMACSECGYYDPNQVHYEEYDPDTHEGYEVFVIDTPSTATTEGRGHYEWSCCHEPVLNENGTQDFVTICRENEHEWILEETIIEPNCGSEGYGSYICGVCGLTKEDVIPNDDYEHSWGEWTVTAEPDCKTEKDGSQKHVCSECGAEETETLYFEHLWRETRLTESTCLTRGSWTMVCEVCGYYDPREVEYEDYDPENHEGVKKLVVDEAATTQKEGKGHYEWSCCGAKVLNEREEVLVVTIPKLTPESSKNVLSDIVVGVTEGGQSGEKSAAEEALDSASDGTILDITIIVNQAFDDLAKTSENEITDEERQEYVDTIQAAAESAVIIGSKADNPDDAAKSITIKLPTMVSQQFKDIINNFYKIQYNTILGKDTSNLIRKAADPSKGEGITLTGIEYKETTAKEYKNAVAFTENTYEHISGVSGLIRQCSNEKVTNLVMSYVNQIGVRTYTDFEAKKKDYDLEFAKNVYRAILLNMQTQTIANLTESYEKLAKDAVGTALDELTEEYNAQLAACKDIDQFEWLVIEIMRQKYNSYISNQYSNNLITYDEYKAKFVPEGEASLAKFKEIYEKIFYKWVLGDDAITYGYTEDYGITLQELTEMAIETVSLKEKPVELSKVPTAGEITVAVVFGTLCLLTAGALVVLEILKKKKGVVAA